MRRALALSLIGGVAVVVLAAFAATEYEAMMGLQNGRCVANTTTGLMVEIFRVPHPFKPRPKVAATH